MRRLLQACAAALALMAMPAAAQDSGFSRPGAVAHLSQDAAIAFSKQIEVELAQQGARVAIVFRTGRARDQLPEGISYTHGAFWVYQNIQTADGAVIPGYAVYNLYHGEGENRTRSYLAQDFPLDFVAGSAVDDVAVIVPTPEMQRRILGVMGSPTYTALHVPDYALVANPYDPRFQNCNEFMLDVIASAAWETTDYAQIKANLREHYRATRVRVSGLQRLVGPMMDERLRTSDHRRGRIETATYESMAAFMTQHGLARRTYVLQRDPAFVFAGDAQRAGSSAQP